MQYTKGQFSVLPPTSEEFRSNWDRTFGKSQSSDAKKPYAPPALKTYAPVDDEPTDPGMLPCANCRTGGHEHCLSVGGCRCYFCLRDKYVALRDDFQHFAQCCASVSTGRCDRCVAILEKHL